MTSRKELIAKLRTDRSHHDHYRVLAVDFTSTELRTKTKAILAWLRKGKSVRIFKGGHPLGEIVPITTGIEQYFEVVGYTKSMLKHKVSDVLKTDLWDERQRQVLQLRVMEQKSLAEVSAVIGISRWAVTKITRDALKMIGERYVVKI